MKILLLGNQGNLGAQFEKFIGRIDDHKLTAWDRDDVDITDRQLIIEKISNLKDKLPKKSIYKKWGYF